MPDATPTNSLVQRPYPSTPAKRYRQHRVGNREQGTTQNSVWTVTLNATGGLWICLVVDATGRQILQATPISIAQSTVSPVASAATMQTMLEGQVGTGNVTVTGGPGASGGGTPYVLTFLGELAGQRISIVGNAAFITGGGATQTTVETTVGGTPGAAVPTGPSLSTKDAVPVNGPVAREA